MLFLDATDRPWAEVTFGKDCGVVVTGARGLMAAPAVEWGTRSIRVVAVGQGIIDTKSTRRAAAQIPVKFAPFETHAKSSLAQRACFPADIAQVATFLLADSSDYVTGSTWLVDGGEVASGGMA